MQEMACCYTDSSRINCYHGPNSHILSAKHTRSPTAGPGRPSPINDYAKLADSLNGKEWHPPRHVIHAIILYYLVDFLKAYIFGFMQHLVSINIFLGFLLFLVFYSLFHLFLSQLHKHLNVFGLPHMKHLHL